MIFIPFTPTYSCPSGFGQRALRGGSPTRHPCQTVLFTHRTGTQLALCAKRCSLFFAPAPSPLNGEESKRAPLYERGESPSLSSPPGESVNSPLPRGVSASADGVFIPLSQRVALKGRVFIPLSQRGVLKGRGVPSPSLSSPLRGRG